MKKSWYPTRKWVAAQAVALGALATSTIDSGWDDLESKLLVGIVVQAAVSYFLSNKNTPGGVPVVADRSV